MKDRWFAECAPCVWQMSYDTQDAAIEAAEEHVYTEHRKVPAHVRAWNRMGMVQFRTPGTQGTEMKPAAPVADEPAQDMPAQNPDPQEGS